MRKAITRRLAEAGASTKLMASITGHKTLKELERYSEKARQKLMAEMAMRGLDNPVEPIALIEGKKN